MRDNPLLALTLVFVPFSMTAFGGGMSVVAGIEQQAVGVHGWLTSTEFLNVFAISRAAPGPGSMLATLIGWHVAGLMGALVATVAMFLPSSILCVAFASVWNRYRGRPWLTILEEAVSPIGVGLLLAGVATLTEIAANTPSAIIIGVMASLICFVRPQTHPIALLASGAILNVVAQAAMK